MIESGGANCLWVKEKILVYELQTEDNGVYIYIMLNRVLVLSLLWVLLTLFSFSCIDDCQCPRSSVFDMVHQSFSLNPVQTQGFGTRPVIDTAYSLAFGIVLDIQYNQVKISDVEDNSRGQLIGSAYACDCLGDRFLNTDPVVNVELYMINSDLNDTLKVTDYFRASTFLSQASSVDSAINYFVQLSNDQYPYTLNQLNLELIEPSQFIGNRKVFATLITRSGKTNFAVTQNIYFR